MDEVSCQSRMRIEWRNRDEVKAPIPLQRGESIDARLAATLVKKAADKRGGGAVRVEHRVEHPATLHRAGGSLVANERPGARVEDLSGRAIGEHRLHSSEDG